MREHRVDAIVRKNGELRLDRLPFEEGEAVKVIILPRPPEEERAKRFPLRGKPLHYDEPMEPVAESDWDALQ